jgi:hypothetical protein
MAKRPTISVIIPVLNDAAHLPPALETVRIAKRYGHIGQLAQREAVKLLDAQSKKPKNAKQAAGNKRRLRQKEPAAGSYPVH